ncbi:MAG: copper homeostasis protein CutC [Bacteroidales bacterium]
MEEGRFILEAGCADLESAVRAARAGAHRIELFASMAQGGITPSAGVIRSLLQTVEIPFRVMIRPRGGDFVYSEDEFRAMCYDVELARQLGVGGIVVGCLAPDLSIDMEKCRELKRLAGSMELTFHRAFDLSRNLRASLDVLIELGFHRVLTSGGSSTAWEGREMLQALCRQAGDNIIIMPGGGVRASHLKALAQATGCKEFHMAPVIQRGTKPAGEVHPNAFYITTIIDEEEIAHAARILKSL